MSTHRPILGIALWGLCIAGCVVAAVVACSGPFSDGPPSLTAFSGATMGTRYMVKVVELPEAVDEKTLKREIHDKLGGLDALLSTYRPDSELSQLNDFDGTDWFSVSPQTACVIREGVEIGRLTGGAFDVTVGPLVNLWNFGPARQEGDRVPSAEEVADVQTRVGWENIEVRLSPPAVRKKRADLYIDLSGIAKGFAVDQVAEHLEQRGIGNYMVEVGGEIRAKGHNACGKSWQIAVESPVAGIRAIQRVVGLDDVAMATSGDYRNYFEKDGTRYSHIIDPRTGRPISHRLASVTVLAPTCARADALATALMVLGPDEGYALAVKQGLPALLISKGEAGFIETETPEFRKVHKLPADD